jgi:hypothetical protein
MFCVWVQNPILVGLLWLWRLPFHPLLHWHVRLAQHVAKWLPLIHLCAAGRLRAGVAGTPLRSALCFVGAGPPWLGS